MPLYLLAIAQTQLKIVFEDKINDKKNRPFEERERSVCSLEIFSPAPFLPKAV